MSDPVGTINIFGKRYQVSGGAAVFDVVADTTPEGEEVKILSSADEERLVLAVVAALEAEVIGTVGEDKVIMIATSNLASGTYTLKYEDADGNAVPIGTITV